MIQDFFLFLGCFSFVASESSFFVGQTFWRIIEREKNDKRRKEYWLIIDCIKLKSKVAVNGKKGFEYLVTVCGSEFDRNNFSFWQCSYDEELPTYGVLYKREVNGIPEELCPRCKKTNEIEVSDLIKESIYEYETKMIDEKKSEEAAIVRDINFDFIRVRIVKRHIITISTRYQKEKIINRLDFHNDYLTKTVIILRSIKKHFFSFVLSSSFLALDIDSMFRLGNLKRNGSFSTW
ncbi:hypothetical protein GLOIN_2v1771490 [Rhizophagus irregularis DAOM 181602=DAOM 197198]|nr:hypothetical protein GLOIN_2v1771490 [Rhizophagus irregularis DAOM 181602=DAOM 197198]